MIIGLIESDCFLMSTKNKKMQATAHQLFYHHGSINGSLALTHDQCDPSKNGDPRPTDPFPSLILVIMSTDCLFVCLPACLSVCLSRLPSGE